MTSIMKRRVVVGAVGFLMLASASMILSDRATAGGPGAARAVLHDQAGNEVGVIQFIQQGDSVFVQGAVETTIGSFPAGVPAGFKGFHIHAGSGCVGNFVSSAGGHYGHDASNPTTTPHGTHEGDMPVVLVNEDGTGATRFATDRVKVEDILGRVVILHAGADNYANVTRYGTPDATTLGTGDAGGRYACGVIE